MRDDREPQDGSGRVPLGAIAAAVVVMAIVLITFAPPMPTKPQPEYPSARSMVRADPIPAEALVFKTRPEELALALDARARPEAQPRTLATYRSVRAYPGAPPRVAHGLTEEEFRGTLCNSCHLRGGYVERFARYAPVTPHPEYVACLQCHAVDAMRAGIPHKGNRPDVVCSQCHVDPDRPPPSLVSLDWASPAWPAPGRRAMEGSPPAIPHDLQLRGNCVACHAGPGSIREIRTTHAARANCRQCHVTTESDRAFVRGAP